MRTLLSGLVLMGAIVGLAACGTSRTTQSQATHPANSASTGAATAARSHAATTTPTASPTTATTASTSTATGANGIPADVPTSAVNPTIDGEQPPIPPAMIHTTAGAIAFARFFIQTVDWGFATTSSTYMRHYFDPACAQCADLEGEIDRAQSAGRRYVGGRVRISQATAQNPDTQYAADMSVTVHMAVTSDELLDSAGAFVTAETADNQFQEQVWVRWQHNAWTVVYALGGNS